GGRAALCGAWRTALRAAQRMRRMRGGEDERGEREEKCEGDAAEILEHNASPELRSLTVVSVKSRRAESSSGPTRSSARRRSPARRGAARPTPRTRRASSRR